MVKASASISGAAVSCCHWLSRRGPRNRWDARSIPKSSRRPPTNGQRCGIHHLERNVAAPLPYILKARRRWSAIMVMERVGRATCLNIAGQWHFWKCIFYLIFYIYSAKMLLKTTMKNIVFSNVFTFSSLYSWTWSDANR